MRMARRSKVNNPEEIREELVELLQNFKTHLAKSDLRAQVLELVPAHLMLRDLGSSLQGVEAQTSARERILLYFKKYVGEVICGDELMVVAGISEYARRIRELRVQFGWKIVSGVTLSEMSDDGERLEAMPTLKPDEYMLMSLEQDKHAAFRWHVANEIRKNKDLSVRDKILLFLRKNTGEIVSGEELRYVADRKSEWARRTRELRTELGWPIATKANGRPDLPIGTYVLEDDRQLPQHDRAIKDDVRRSVLMRDKYTCQMIGCAWHHDLWNPSDPRHLEVHHIMHHKDGGSNLADNLITYCNICHDKVHRREGRGR